MRDINNLNREHNNTIINEMDLEVIAEQIKDGCTSGLFSDGDKRVSWEININKF